MAKDNIDKAVNAIVGETIEEAIDTNEPVDVEIVSEEITVSDEPLDATDDFYANLAEEMDESDLGAIASQLMEDYENDKSSREEWARTYTQGLDLLGFGFRGTFPYERLGARGSAATGGIEPIDFANKT